MGAPVGLLLLRALLAPEGALRWSWPAAEVASDPVTYAYLALSTLVVFAAFGWWVGGQADALAELSETDAMTGLRNRRALMRRMDEELARAVRSGAPPALLLFDVDHLKQINDGAGHAAGDAALRRVAGAIQENSRAIDVAARFAGDEFALLAPETDARDAARLAERVRERLAAGGPQPTVSAGVATLAAGVVPSDAAAAELVRRADAALYCSKRDGRDRVTLAPESVT